MGMYHCEACDRPCDDDDEPLEQCLECGLVVCSRCCVHDDRDRTLCKECGAKEAKRQMVADAPGVWPDWAKGLALPDAPKTPKRL